MPAASVMTSRGFCLVLSSCPSGRRVKSVRLVPSWAGGRWAFGWRTVLPGVETARGWGEAGPSAAVETCGGSLRLGRLEATAQDLEGLLFGVNYFSRSTTITFPGCISRL